MAQIKLSEFPKLESLESRVNQEILFPVIIEDDNGVINNYIANANDIVDLLNDFQASNYFTKDEVLSIKTQIEDGYKQVTITIYTSSEDQPSTPIGGSYDFTIVDGRYVGFSNNLAGWQTSLEGLSSPIWQSKNTFYKGGTQAGWSYPSRIINTDDISASTQLLINDAKGELTQLIQQAAENAQNNLNSQSEYFISQINQNAQGISSLVGRVADNEATMSTISQKADNIDLSVKSLQDDVIKVSDLSLTDSAISLAIAEAKGDQVTAGSIVLDINDGKSEALINADKIGLGAPNKNLTDYLVYDTTENKIKLGQDVKIEWQSDWNSKITEGAQGKSAYECYLETTTDNPVLTEEQWLNALVGNDGKSAYQIYLDTTTDNPKKTEAQWIASLDGKNGLSAYDIYVAQSQGEGETPLTEEEWLASLSGTEGKSAYECYLEVAGSNPLTKEQWLHSLVGNEGASAYEIYLSTVPEGETPMSLEEWLESLDGEDGLSAYDIYVAQGGSLSLEEWLASLNGSNGADGLGVVSVETEYALSDSNSTTQDFSQLTWSKTISYVEGKYLWSHLKTTYSDGNITYGTPVLDEYVNRMGSKLTYIGANGLYTGTVAADNVVVGNSLSVGDAFVVDNTDPSNPKLKLSNNVAIQWDSAWNDQIPSGKTPYIGDNGNWWIDGVDTGVKAQGTDGTSVKILGTKNDESELPTSGNNGDGYIINGELYIWDGTQWVNVGRIKGEDGKDGKDGIDGKDGAPGKDGVNGAPGEAGASIEARYSSDKTNWHTSFQEGDVWMQTKSSIEVTWGAAIRIVGEDGNDGKPADYTVYSFGISSASSTANSSIAPVDITTWTDAPANTTTDKPYLWMKMTPMTYTVDHFVEGASRYVRLTGENGKDGTNGTDGVDGYTQVTEVLHMASNIATKGTIVKPTTQVTETSDSVYNTWTLSIPKINTDYVYYYTCLQTIKKDKNGNIIQPGGVTWGNVEEDHTSFVAFLADPEKPLTTYIDASKVVTSEVISNCTFTGRLEANEGWIGGWDIDDEKIYKEVTNDTDQVNVASVKGEDIQTEGDLPMVTEKGESSRILNAIYLKPTGIETLKNVTSTDETSPTTNTYKTILDSNGLYTSIDGNTNAVKIDPSQGISILTNGSTTAQLNLDGSGFLSDKVLHWDSTGKLYIGKKGVSSNTTIIDPSNGNLRTTVLDAVGGNIGGFTIAQDQLSISKAVSGTTYTTTLKDDILFTKGISSGKSTEAQAVELSPEKGLNFYKSSKALDLATTDPAKNPVKFNLDGSGYLAQGNFTWDINGDINIGKYTKSVATGVDGDSVEDVTAYYTTISSDGILNTSNINAIGGKVGGWTIDDTKISSSINYSDGSIYGYTSAGSINLVSGKGLIISNDSNVEKQSSYTRTEVLPGQFEVSHYQAYLNSGYKNEYISLNLVDGFKLKKVSKLVIENMGDDDDEGFVEQISETANVEFSMDGSGYLAKGNLTWGTNGTISLLGLKITKENNRLLFTDPTTGAQGSITLRVTETQE